MKQDLNKNEFSNQERQIEKTFIEGSSAPLSTSVAPNSGGYEKPQLPSGNDPIKIGNGTIVCIIGCGGMAKLYKIWVEKLEIFRAIKILLPSMPHDAYQRFETEARITAKLRHQNIVEIHSVDEWNGLPFIEMEFLDGLDLKQTIRHHGRLPLPVCTAAAILICRALAYAHSQRFVLYGKHYEGIIHRDLKPENIMITKTGLVKLMDFGIARPTQTSLHTIDGNITGTLPYLSPEQMDGHNIDERTDIYPLGAILFEMITGEMLFPQQEITKLLQAKSRSEFRKPSEFGLQLPSTLTKIINKCLEYNKEDRYTTADDLLYALERMHHGITKFSPEKTMVAFMEDPGVLPDTHAISIRIEKKKWFVNPATIAGAAAILVALVAVLIFTLPKQTLTAVPKKENSVQQSAPNLTENVSVNNDSMPDGALLVVPKATEELPQRAASSELTSAFSQKARAVDQSVLPEKKAVKTLRNGNLSSGIESALALGNFLEVTTLLTTTPINTKEKVSLAIRCLDAAGKILGLTRSLQLFEKVECDDGAYYLQKGQMALLAKKLQSAVNNLRKSMSTSSLISSPELLRRQGSYFLANAYTELYETNKTDQNLRQAISTWKMVQTLLSNETQHPYYSEAGKKLEALNSSAGY